MASVSAASLEFPRGLARNAAGAVLVADENNHRICAIEPSGQIVTIAGSRVRGFADGPADAAQFHGPRGLGVDSAGNVLVADARNHRIRRITPDGVVSTLAGCGLAGHEDGPADEAKFDFPFGLAVDEADNIFVADENNHCVRQIAPDGTVSTLAGRGGSASRTSCGFNDGVGGSAAFNFPRGLAMDGDGSSVLLADENNHRVRRVARDGTVSTFAGSGLPGFIDGPAATARFNVPRALVIDENGCVFVADARNHAIRKVAPDGSVTTLAGGASRGYADGFGATAQFDYPFGLALDTDGSILVADENNHSIRKIRLDGGVSTIAGRPPVPHSPPASQPALQIENTSASVTTLSLLAGRQQPAPPLRQAAAESLAQKVERVSTALELEPGLSLRHALHAANELMGLHPSPADSLPAQADKLLAEIGI